jgi:hypothetical protein
VVSSFSLFQVAKVFSSKFSLVEKTNQKIYTLRNIYVLWPNDRCESYSKSWSIIELLLWNFHNLRAYFSSSLHYFSHFFDRNSILRLNYISRIHSLTNRRHVCGNVLLVFCSLNWNDISSWRLVTSLTWCFFHVIFL